MTDAPWTPGPWEIGQNRTKTRGIDIVQRKLTTIVASIYVPKYTDATRQEHDARLIAAAPEMAEALSNMVEIVDFVERRYGGRINSPTVDNARAILARIKGETL